MTTGEPRGIFAPSLRSTTTGLLILITLIAFEAMAVSAALPTAARDVHGLAEYGWAFTGFLVANVVGMVAAGQRSDRRGPRSVLVAGLACFTAGLLLAGSATTMAQLVAGRVVQGLGSGLMITAAYVIIGVAYGERLRPAVFAATSSAWVVPSLVGPALSGEITQHLTWRLVFLGLAPFVVLGGVLMVPVLRSLHPPDVPADAPRSRGRSRLARALAVAVGVGGLEQAGQHLALTSIPVAAVALVFLVWGLRGLLPTGTFRVRAGVPAPVALRGLLAGAFFGVESTVPLSLTLQHHYAPAAAGLPLAAAGFSWAFGSWCQGRVDDSRGPNRRIMLIRTGFAFVAVAAAGMAITSTPSAPGWLAYPSWAVAGLGAGLTMSSLSVLLLRYTNDADRGSDSAALQLSDATSSALTTGLAGVLVAAAARSLIADTAAFVALDAAMAGLALVGAVAAVRARPPVGLPDAQRQQAREVARPAPLRRARAATRP